MHGERDRGKGSEFDVYLNPVSENYAILIQKCKFFQRFSESLLVLFFSVNSASALQVTLSYDLLD